MKQFDEKGLELCKIQADLFALSANKVNGSSYLFIRRYMNSKVCEKMDNYFVNKSKHMDCGKIEKGKS